MEAEEQEEAAAKEAEHSPLTPAMRTLRLHADEDTLCTPVPASPCHVTPAPPPPSTACAASSGDSLPPSVSPSVSPCITVPVLSCRVLIMRCVELMSRACVEARAKAKA